MIAFLSCYLIVLSVLSIPFLPALLFLSQLED